MAHVFLLTLARSIFLSIISAIVGLDLQREVRNELPAVVQQVLCFPESDDLTGSVVVEVRRGKIHGREKSTKPRYIRKESKGPHSEISGRTFARG